MRPSNAAVTTADTAGKLRTDLLRPMSLPNGSVVVQLNPAETSLQYRSIVAERDYFQHGIGLRPRATVLDVGANIGISALFFHWECPGVRVLAFEPAHPLYEALCANLVAHGVNAKAYDCALGSSRGTTALTVYPHTTAMSSMYADVEHDAGVTRAFLVNSGFEAADVADMMTGRHTTDIQKCRVRTISDVLDEEGIDRVDLVKINVEKAERDVLAGISTHDWPRIQQIAMQVHDLSGRLEWVRQDLMGRGFQVATDQDPLLAGTDIYDIFARRKG